MGDLDIEDHPRLRAYLTGRGYLRPGEAAAIQNLPGGVSNRTVLVERPDGEAWVIKQALAKLRVKVDWFSDPSRIHREALGLTWLPKFLPGGTIPPLVFEDETVHIVAMGAVPPPIVNWKEQLLAGVLSIDLVTLNKVAVTEKPLANGQLEMVEAAGINEADILLVTRYSVLRANGIGASYYRPQKQALSLKQATVLLVQDADAKTVTIAEARRLLAKPRPVAVTFRQDARPAADAAHTLWQDRGSAPPDAEAARQTWAQILRPGTLVFVLSAAENEPQP